MVSTPAASSGKFAVAGGLRDERAETGRDEGLAAVAHVLGDDAGVPGAAGGRDEPVTR